MDSFLDASPLVGASTPSTRIERVRQRLWVAGMDEGVGRVRTALDLGVRIAVRGLEDNASRRDRAIRQLTQVGLDAVTAEGLRLVALTLWVLRGLEAPEVEEVEARYRELGGTPEVYASVEARLVELARRLPRADAPKAAMAVDLGVDPAVADRLRARFAALEDGALRTPVDLAVALGLLALVQRGSTDETDEAAAIRLGAAGIRDLVVPPERVARLAQFVDAGQVPDFNDALGHRVHALWSTIEAERAAWASRADAVRARLAPFWRPGQALDPHQLEAIARAEAVGWRAYFADEMGLGKGPAALGAVRLAKVRCLGIVAPVSMQGGWQMECGSWLSEASVRLVVRPSDLEDWPMAPITVGVFSWAFFSLWPKEIRAGVLRRFDGWIFDEIQALSSAESQRSRSIWVGTDRGRFRLGLSGTPLSNGRGVELWGQLRAIDPSVVQIPTLPAWRRRYGGPRTLYAKGAPGKEPRRITVYDGRSHFVEMMAKIGPIFIRRTKRELGVSLPEKVRTVHRVMLSVEEHADIEAARHQARERLRARIEAYRVDQIALGVPEAQVEARVQAKLGSLALASFSVVRRAVAMQKIPATARLVAALVEEGHRPIVFGVHLDALRALAGAIQGQLGAAGRVRSGVDLQSAIARRDLVASWEAGEGEVLVLSAKYNSGVTLVSSDEMVVHERAILPGIEQQQEDRIHRRGQTRRCRYHYVMAPGTSDDVMDAIVTWKERGATMALGSATVRLLRYLLGEDAAVDGVEELTDARALDEDEDVVDPGGA